MYNSLLLIFLRKILALNYCQLFFTKLVAKPTQRNHTQNRCNQYEKNNLNFIFYTSNFNVYLYPKLFYMEKLSKELIGASATPIILSILKKNESYGYEIIQNIKEISGGKIEYGEGTLYPVLHKLEKKGLIKSSWKIAESGRKRKYYNISTEGEKELKTEKENWNTINQIITRIWKIEPNLI